MASRDGDRSSHGDVEKLDLERLAELISRMGAPPSIDGRPNKMAELDPGVRDALGRMNPETAKWLANKRPEELVLLDEVCDRLRTIKTLGKFGRWLVVTVVGCLITGLTLGDKLAMAWKWVAGGTR